MTPLFRLIIAGGLCIGSMLFWAFAWWVDRGLMTWSLALSTFALGFALGGFGAWRSHPC